MRTGAQRRIQELSITLQSRSKRAQVNLLDVLDAAQVARQVEGPLAATEVGVALADELDDHPRKGTFGARERKRAQVSRRFRKMVRKEELRKVHSMFAHPRSSCRARSSRW